ncbi:hypothetical protein Gotur_025120 [Gossypium turneri]
MDDWITFSGFTGRMTSRKVLLIVDNCPAHLNEDMPLKQKIGDVEGIHKLKEVISYLHYRNAMDVEQILNYPNDSSVLPHVSPKEVFLAVDTLKNYLI